MRTFIALLILLPSTLYAATADEIYEATCRINDNGTGVVFTEDSTHLWIITAGHVMADKNNKLEKNFYVHFFSTGKQSHKIKAEPLWFINRKTIKKIPYSTRSRRGTYTRYRTIKKMTTDDLGFLKVKKLDFKDYILPQPVPLAPKGTSISSLSEIKSCGCPHASWPTGWTGNVVSTFDDRFRFLPTPIPGRSGSGIFTSKGIVGIIIWHSTGGQYGTAVSLDNIYKKIEERE